MTRTVSISERTPESFAATFGRPLQDKLHRPLRRRDCRARRAIRAFWCLQRESPKPGSTLAWETRSILETPDHQSSSGHPGTNDNRISKSHSRWPAETVSDLYGEGHTGTGETLVSRRPCSNVSGRPRERKSDRKESASLRSGLCEPWSRPN